MTRTTRIVTASAIAAAVLAAGAIIGAHLQDGAAAVAVTTALTTTAASPTEAPLTVDMTKPPAPTPTTTTVTVPAAGATVPADQVAAVRTAGGHVYVSPNGTGDGLVVEAGQPLPQAMDADYAASGADQDAPTTMAAENARMAAVGAMDRALMDAGIPVVQVRAQGTYNGNELVNRFWVYGIVGVPDYKAINGTLAHQPTRAAAVAAAQNLAAKYGARVVDAG